MSDENQTNSETKPKNKKIIIAAAIIGILVIVIIAYFLFFAKPAEKPYVEKPLDNQMLSDTQRELQDLNTNVLKGECKNEIECMVVCSDPQNLEKCMNPEFHPEYRESIEQTIIPIMILEPLPPEVREQFKRTLPPTIDFNQIEKGEVPEFFTQPMPPD